VKLPVTLEHPQRVRSAGRNSVNRIVEARVIEKPEPLGGKLVMNRFAEKFVVPE